MRNLVATVATSCPSITTSPTRSVISADVSRALTASSNRRTSGFSFSVRITGVMFSASWRRRSSRSGTNPFSSIRGSVENSNPTCTSSLRSAVDGQRPTGVERSEVVEDEPIDAAQPGEAERPYGAFRRSAERQLIGNRDQRAHRGQVEPFGRLRIHDELVGVFGRRRCEQGDPPWTEQSGIEAGHIDGVGGRLGVRVEEQEERRQVLGLHVDLARLQGTLRRLSRPQVQLSLDLVAGVLQDLCIHLRDDLVLGEGAGHADDDRVRPGGPRCSIRLGAGARGKEDTRHQDGHRAQDPMPEAPDRSAQRVHGEPPWVGRSTSATRGIDASGTCAL